MKPRLLLPELWVVAGVALMLSGPYLLSYAYSFVPVPGRYRPPGGRDTDPIPWAVRPPIWETNPGAAKTVRVHAHAHAHATERPRP